MTTESEFWDKVSAKYSSKPVPSEERYQKKLAISRKYLSSDSTILEFGCGTGTTALNHSEDVKHITAYDFSPAMIDIAKQKCAANEKFNNVEFKVAPVEEINFGHEQYDAIMGHSILHLTFDNETTLKRIYYGLKPGGVFISGTGCIKDMNPLLRWVLPLITMIGMAPKINAFTAEELVTLHIASGFEIVERWDYTKGEIYLVAKKPPR